MNATSVSQLPSSLLESKQPTILAVCGLFIALETIVFTVRTSTKWTCKVSWGWDDILILLGYVCSVAVAIAAICDVIYGGIGLHFAYVHLTAPEKVVVLFKIVRALPFVYLAAVVFPKLAIIHLYLSIFVQKLFRRICWIVVAIMVANWIATTIANASLCIPYDQRWNPSPTGYCLPVNPFYTWASFANMITDVIIIVLPIRYIWKLKISVATRAGILFTFFLGGIGLLSSILRFVGFADTDEDNLTDPTWYGSIPLIWTVVEPGSYFIAACLPVCRPLVRRLSNGILRKITTLRSGASYSITDNSKRLGVRSEAASDRGTLVDSLKMDGLSTEGKIPPVPRAARNIHVTTTNTVEFEDL